jgi:hypothetical protein
MKRIGLVLTIFMVFALCSAAQAGQATRVKNLYVDDKARPYFDIVAFAPGSGWVKAKSPEMMRPLLNLNDVTPADLKRFNGYTRNCDLLVRAEFSKGILYLVMNDTDIQYLTRMNRIERNLHWEPEKKPRLAIIKDYSGKTFLVKRVIDVRTANRP